MREIKRLNIAPSVRPGQPTGFPAGHDALTGRVFVAFKSLKNIEAIGIETTTSLESADKFAKLLSADYPNVPILRSTVSPVLGVYGGPKAIAVSVLEEEEK